MENITSTKPCKVKSEQGFYIEYKNRSLYSKYNPSKSILSAVEKLEILPGTLILAVSPVLPYGLKELEEKLPENCLIFAVETDPLLREFIENEKTLLGLKKTVFPAANDLSDLPKLLHQKPYSGMFRRVIRLDFSGGAALSKSFYDSLQEALVLSIKQYWANRVTIQKFGLKWHENIFKNLSILKSTVSIKNYMEAIQKPIVVVGAGKSAREAVPLLKKNSQSFFVLAVDTAFQILNTEGIKCDGIVLEEAQNAIRETFIGADKEDLTVFASLSSVHHPVKDSNKICYFATRFSETEFWNKLSGQDFFPFQIPPYGSVGLTAVKLALSFRKSHEVPVFVYGLDFSFEAGTTHANGTAAHKRLLRATEKKRPFENYSCFSPYSVLLSDKNGEPTYTLPVMKTYRDLFEDTFKNEKNLWDCGSTGLELGLPKAQIPAEISLPKIKPELQQKISPCSASIFLQQEKCALEELKALLTGEGNYSEEERTTKIVELAKPREYLYLHFPDGQNFSNSLSFLKRIRATIDLYLKILR